MVRLFERAFNKYNDKGYFKWVSDKTCLKILYHLYFKKRLDLDNPCTFNEKLQWLKLNNRQPEYTMLVDKYGVKKYIEDRIGKQYLIPTLGVWDRFDDIDFDNLPQQFVLKCTHDSGSIIVVKDKSVLDKNEAKKKLEKNLKRTMFYTGREWPYKNVKPRIIAETYMEDESSADLKDYKFYCFNGEPKFLYVSEGLSNHDTARLSFLTLDWNFAEFSRDDFKPLEVLPPKPSQFDEMIQISKQLSQNVPFLRVDLYEINGRVYFSELTFFPCSGFMRFKPDQWDRTIGDWVEINKNC